MWCREVAVLFKIVADPEGVFSVDGGGLPGQNLPQVPSVFDENAVEAAVQIKEATQCKVTVFCVGAASAEPLLKRTLAMGADEVVLVEEAGTEWDSLGAARMLAAALAARGRYDLVLCGREAADTGSGLVGPYVAQALGMAFLTLASEITVHEQGVRVRRICDGGHDVFECRPPLLLTVSGDANRPRMPSVLKMLQVKKTPVHKLALQAAQLPPLPGPAQANILNRSTPTVVGQCSFIGGANAADKATALLRALRAEGVLQ